MRLKIFFPSGIAEEYMVTTKADKDKYGFRKEGRYQVKKIKSESGILSIEDHEGKIQTISGLPYILEE